MRSLADELHWGHFDDATHSQSAQSERREQHTAVGKSSGGLHHPEGSRSVSRQTGPGLSPPGY